MCRTPKILVMSLILSLFFSSAFARDGCALFLSRAWFKERSLIRKSAKKISDQLSLFEEAYRDSLAQTKAMEENILEKISAGRIQEALDFLDSRSDLIKNVVRISQDFSELKENLLDSAHTIRNSKLPFAQSKRNKDALFLFDQFDTQLQNLIQISKWPDTLIQNELEKIHFGGANIIFGNPNYKFSKRVPYKFKESREKHYDKGFILWTDLSRTLSEFSKLDWNIHLGAEAYQRALILEEYAQYSLDNQTSDLENSPEFKSLGESVKTEVIQTEIKYFKYFIKKTSLIKDLIRASVLLSKRASGDREKLWESSLQAAAEFLNEIQKQFKSLKTKQIKIRDRDSDLLSYYSIEKVYHRVLLAITYNYIRSLRSIVEIANEAEVLIENNKPNSLYLTLIKTQASVFVDMGLDKIEVAERLGLYDGHGTDPSRIDSVTIGTIEQRLRKLKQTLSTLCPSDKK